MTLELGLIEGYFGRNWSWADRKYVVATLAGAGYTFFHYAPKVEALLRRRWRDPFADSALRALADFAGLCRSHGVRFGMGLTPFDALRSFGTAERRDLRAKLGQLRSLGLDDLLVMFDDLRGDVPDVALRQAEIVGECTAENVAARVFMVPSYYSDDPVLDRVFGPRPIGYLRDLGANLGADVAIYWTGEEICSREYSPGHLNQVADELGRKVALWDNYPVNDGSRKAGFLNLRAFTGRPASLAGYVTHHAVNPLSQPRLGCIPALTLSASYRLGDRYCYGRAFRDAASMTVGPEMADMLLVDLALLQDVGLEAMGDHRARLVTRYRGVDHPAAAEIVDWLEGGYAIGDEVVLTQ